MRVPWSPEEAGWAAPTTAPPLLPVVGGTENL